MISRTGELLCSVLVPGNCIMTNTFHLLILIGHRLATSHDSASGTSSPLWLSLRQCLGKPRAAFSPNVELLSGRSFCHCLNLYLKPQALYKLWYRRWDAALPSGCKLQDSLRGAALSTNGKSYLQICQNTHTSSTPTLLYSDWLKEDAGMLILGKKNSST